MTLEQFFGYFDRYGLALVGLVIVLLAVRQICRGVVRWLRPYIDRFIDAHLQLVDSLQTNLQEQSKGHDVTHSQLEKVLDKINCPTNH